MTPFDKSNFFLLIVIYNLSIVSGTNFDILDRSTTEIIEIKNTFDLLSKGQAKIKLCECDEATFILGNSGSGKSTLTQWLFGDSEKLISKELARGEYIIVDGGERIGSSSVDSMTTFPELVLDSKARTAYYDCPGFSDTRSTSHEIATSYFIKQITDHAKKVKMIFTVSFHSVRRGVDRYDFRKLLSHNIDFIENIEKFNDSIALVVTKVDNIPLKIAKRKYELVPDHQVIEGIVNFLKEMKHELEDKLNSSKSNEKFHTKAIQILNILLIKNNESYPRIGIFRRPDEEGPLSNISLLQEAKMDLKKLVTQLKFTIKSNYDFGYTISEKSKNIVNGLVDVINGNVSNQVSKITMIIQNYYDNILDQLEEKIKNFHEISVPVASEESDAHSLTIKLFKGKFLSTLVTNITSINEFGERIKTSCSSLNIVGCEKHISNILLNGQYIDFLQTVMDHKLLIGLTEWGNSFQITATQISTATNKAIYQASNEVVELTEPIESKIAQLIQQLRLQYKNRKHSLGILRFLRELSQGYNAIKDMELQVLNVHRVGDLCKKINAFVKLLNITDGKINSLILSICENGKRLKFLEILIGEDKISPRLLQWIDLLSENEQYFSDHLNWDTFLIAFYDKLSEFEVQNNSTELKSLGSISNGNYREFVKSIEKFDIDELAAVRDITMTSSQIWELDDVISITLKKGIDHLCSDNKLVIKGDFIKFSDFLSSDHSLLFKCNSEIESIMLYALNSVFIDQDLVATGKKLQVTIIAPKWEIFGARKIVLDGVTGKSHDKAKANDGNQAGDHGRNGKPGLPGGSAGSFLGIGEVFINGSNLKISASGGKGGPGQDGGNGIDAEKGKNAKCSQTSEYIDESTKSTVFVNNIIVVSGTLKVHGWAGGVGGNAGDAGTGGVGGNFGNIEIIYLSNKPVRSKIVSLAEIGQEGPNGRGGNYGKGGRNGESNTCNYAKMISNVYWTYFYELQMSKPEISEYFGSNGKIGGINIIFPTPADSVVVIQDPIRIINKYKHYLIAHSVDIFKKETLIQFFNLLDNNSLIRKKYGTLLLVEEFEGLENQIHMDKLQRLPFYRSLLNRIRQYSKQTHHNEISEQYKKVLSFLYTAALSKIYILEHDLVPCLLIDNSEYFTNAVQEMNLLKGESKISKLIHNKKTNFKKEIEKKITEITMFVEAHIKPEISVINDLIDDKISSLISEIIKLTKNVEKNKQQLEKEKRELETAMRSRIMFSGLKLIGSMICFLGPYGAAAGVIIQGGSSMAESLLIDSNVNKTPIIQIPPNTGSNLNILSSKITTAKDRRNNEFTLQIDEITRITEENSELKNITGLTNDLKSKQYNNQKTPAIEENLIEQLEKQLKEALENKELELKIQKNKKNRKSIDAQAKIIKAKQVLEIGSVGFDIYNKHKNDDTALGVIQESIQEAEYKIKALRKHEENFHKTMIPMIQTMTNELKIISNNLGSKSQASLDITKWQVQNALRDMKLNIQQLTQGYKVESIFSRFIEKLEEAITTLIKVYDRLQNYQDQQNLAIYIADISSAASLTIITTDTKLGIAVTNLEIAIKYNILLNEYKTAIDSFKQWIFPFAHLYMNDIELPSNLQLEKNIENLLSKAVTHINDMNKKIKKYKMSIQKHDQYILSGDFSSEYVSSKPFFVWKNHAYKDMISQLLLGKKVVVKADVMKSAKDKNAIKFFLIGITFKLANETRQLEMNEKLKGFMVSLTHMGNSYYRYNSEIYVITTDSLNFQYSFEKNKENEPVTKTDTYSKIKAGDLMLSPYGMWEIQLIESSNSFSFDDLNIFKHEVDIELAGQGSYVSIRYKSTDLKLDNYYEQYYG